MFSNKELSLIHNRYFNIIKEIDNYIEFQSKDTKHCWIIHKHNFNDKMAIYIYHKHYIHIKYYHKHWQTYTVKQAIESIIKHDSFVLNSIDK